MNHLSTPLLGLQLPILLKDLVLLHPMIKLTIPEELDKYFKHIDYNYEDDTIFITGFYLNKPGDVDNMIALLNAIKERMDTEEQN